MARNKEKKVGGSYDQIMTRIVNFKPFKQKFEEICNSVDKDIKFTIKDVMWDSVKGKFIPRYYMFNDYFVCYASGDMSENYLNVFTSTPITEPIMALNGYHRFMSEFVWNNCGKGNSIPLYNIPKSKVIEHLEYNLVEKIVKTYKIETSEVNDRFKSEATKVYNSDQFKEAFNELSVRKLIETLKEPLRKYGRLITPEILEVAKNEYLIENIIDT